MSATGKIAAYSAFILLLLALVYEMEREEMFSIPSDIKNPMNIITILLLAVLVVLAALHLRSGDDDDD